MISKFIDFLSLLLKKNKNYLRNFFKKVWEIILKPEMMILPGQLAFFIILSVVPIVSILSWIGNVFGISVATVTEILTKIFNEVKLELIIPNILNQEFDLRNILIVIIMFYIASGGANSVIVASNQIYGIKQASYFKRRLKAFFMTLLLCILCLFMLVVPLLGHKILSSFNYFDLKYIIDPILTIIRGPITWVVIYFFIKSIYVLAPDKDIKRKGLNLGALFSTIFWVLATYLYSGWINNFSSYDRYYGSLSSFAILMLWIYWLCYIFVIGLCLNVKVENEELEKTGIVKLKK